MGRPIQTVAEARAERHARTFTPRQAPRDYQVEHLMKQIASILQKPLIDVRLAMAVVGKKERAR